MKKLVFMIITTTIVVSIAVILSSFTNENESLSASSSGACYCKFCDDQQLSTKWEYEYDCVACNRCNRTGKLACKGSNGKLDHWENCPDCSCVNDRDNRVNCSKDGGYIWKVVRQYQIYYCPRCKREYSGC